MCMNIFYKYVKDIIGDKMRIKEILKKGIVSVNINMPLYEVASIMKKHNIGFLPVLKENKVLGVITDRDIVINAVANNCDNNSPIEDYINKNVIKIDWNRELKDALDLMRQNKIKRLLIVDGDKYIGVLSLSDIIEKEEKATLEAIKTIWQIEDKERLKDAEIDEFYL
ncbi:MAG: CBS domain-containing protein [Firmicutes bacterium]|nr:CBS domain-containing protein [Bacillota bacterium]